MDRSLRVSLWAVAALLAACGGGGGSGGGSAPTPTPPPPPPAPGTFNANAAWRNFLATSNTWSVSGVASNGNTYTISLAVAPSSSAVFPVNGLIYGTSTATVLSGIPGLATDQTISISYYDPATYKLAGTKTVFDNGAPTCSVVTATALPPDATAVGTTGPMQTFNDLQGCLGTSPLAGTSVTTWSIETESGINYFCLNTTAKDTAGTTLQTEGDCVQVVESGSLGAAARITLTRPGFSLVAKSS